MQWAMLALFVLNGAHPSSFLIIYSTHKTLRCTTFSLGGPVLHQSLACSVLQEPTCRVLSSVGEVGEKLLLQKLQLPPPPPPPPQKIL